MDFNKEYLEGIKQGKIRHKYYKYASDHARDMGVHVEGETPEYLLNINRPNEQPEIKKYRLDSWQPVTTSLAEKVINTVNKVFNPRLYSFNFPEQFGEDTLSVYLMERFPYYRSIMNFITETFTQKDFSDPNAVIAVEPLTYEIEETERFSPIPIIYTTESLVDFGSGYYTFLLNNEIKIFTENEILIYGKANDEWELKWVYEHNFNHIPVFRMGGMVKGKSDPFYYESFIRGVLPHWNQVVQLTSDLQAAYVNHLFMEKWEFETDCNDCVGGYVDKEIMNGLEKDTVQVVCSNCNGRGKVSKSPYGIHTINRDAINPDAALPTPPAGYIDKNTEIVTKVEDRIEKEEKRGLASINMEIVQMVGNDQSGVAKTVDREDLNAFLSRYSRHVFEYVLPNLIKNIALWRYSFTSDIKNILPEISQPKHFNILTLDELSEEYKNATNSNVSDGYLQHIELELVQSKFANNDKARKLNKALILLNPYPGRSDDDLLTLQNLGEKKWMIYKFIHLIELVSMAIENNSEFLDLKLSDQRKIIDDLAKQESGWIENPRTIIPEN